MSFEATATKKPVNVSINSDLLRQAKELKINVSQVLEAALTSQVKRLRQEQWQLQNRKAIEAFNRQVDANEVWNESWRDALWAGKAL